MTMTCQSNENLECYSFSKLTTFEQCPFQYYLNYILGEKGETNAFAQYGSFMHELLEKYEKKELALEELANEFEENFDVYITKEFPFYKLYQSYYDDGLNFLTDFKGFPNCKIIEAEKYFALPVQMDEQEDFNVRGFIDLIYKDEKGRLVVHDWKSKAGFKTKAEQKKYARQLYMYSYYIKEKYGKAPDLLRFGMFRKQQYVDIPYNEADFEGTFDWIRETVSAIRQETKFRQNKDDFFCGKLCDFRSIGMC